MMIYFCSSRPVLSTVFALLIAVMGCFSPTVHAQQAELVTTYTLPNAIVWEPNISYISVTLNVGTPDGEIFSEVFNSGEEPVYSSNDLVDGSYTYELRFQTSVTPGERDDSGEDGLNSQAAPLTVSGAFGVESGSILDQGAQSESDSDGGVVTRDQVFLDDLIVDGSACIGFDCINDEAFGFDTLRLKENNLRIKFDDTTSIGSFPYNDWQILVNDSAEGGLNRFSIEDITGGVIPFTIEAGASANALYVDDTGKLGLGTSVPSTRIHVKYGDSPALRIEQDGSAGFTPQAWDLSGNETNFFIRDVTNGSRLPFRIRPGAPTSSIDIAASGAVGLGASSPAARLHILTSDASHTDLARFENTSGSNQGVNIKLVSGTNEWTIGVDGVENKMMFRSADEALFSIDPKTRLVFAKYGLTSGGIIHHASDRDKKDSFKAIETEDVLNKVLQLPISQWKFKTESNDIRHIGPTSQDFMSAFGLGTDEKFIDTVDADGVALAAIQGLNTKLMQSLEERDDAIAKLLLRIEALENAVATAPDGPLDSGK